MRLAPLRAALPIMVVALGILGPSPVLAQPKGGAAAATGDKDPHEDLALAVGETKTLSAAGVKSFSEGVGGVVDVRVTPEGSQFVIVGKKPGNTSLVLLRNDGTKITYDISVSQRPPQLVEREVNQLIEGFPGVRLRRIGGRFFIEGGVSTEGDAKRMALIASLYPGQVESVVTVGPGTERKILIRLDFFYVQYEKTSSYAVGLAWPGSIGGDAVVQSQYAYDFIAKTTTTAQASVVNQPLPRLDVSARRGWAKILKQSTVITGNGSEAVYQSGGEQNFLANVGLATGLQKVQFGTNIAVLPRFDSATKDVEIKLSADVADLVAPAAGSVPGRTTTKLETLVTLKLGQALILSGIKTQTRRQSVTGLPLLSEIPVLGVLFGSHTKDEAEVEGAVFVVPSVIETVPKSALELIKNAMATYKEYSGDIADVDVYPKAPPSAK